MAIVYLEVYLDSYMALEDLYIRVRREIYEAALLRINSYPDINIETETGPLHIRDYAPKIIEDGFFGGELEISIASNIYNINIATYNEIIDNNNPIGYTNINYYNNNDNNQNRHLMILINYNNIHFRMGYYNLTIIIDFNYNINNEENESNSEEIFEKNYFSNINALLELKKNFNDFTNKSLNELMELYKEESNEIVGYDDIYYYIYQNNKGEIIGKYSEKFAF